MTKDNSTGKNKEFYDLGKAMFDRIQVLPEHRALKHRIHELEGELMGYKKIVADQDATLERQTARIVGLQDEIRNLTGEEE